MLHGSDKAAPTSNEARHTHQMTYVESQASSLPRVERASVSRHATATADPSKTAISNERLMHD